MEEEDLTLTIHIISRLTHIHYAGELRKLGLSMGQFPFLMGIYRNRGASQEEISNELRISKSATASVIGQLIASGLVERTVDPADRRKFRLALTGKGLALIPRLEEIIRHCHAMVTAEFSDGEKTILQELLRRAEKNSEQNL